MSKAALPSFKFSQITDVKDKIVFVSGGAKGIGLMIAHAYVIHGAKVVISSRDEKTCTGVAEGLTKLGPGTCYSLAGDLSKDSECKRVAEELAKREQHLDVLINNSGANWGEEIETYPSTAFDKVMSLNVKSVFLLTRYLLPLLEKAAEKSKTPASVINIGSVDGVRVPGLETYAYSASKVEAFHLIKTLIRSHSWSF
ncbi:hypothetical protein PROFUN_09447 [Planoprotostelium fungivorum]|uniref:Uncharacterized protein n=1 Tax=Planoprotostelium fungivorum TaxID=1890364 RepID=A0A2P6NH13_9EUKA|nr:hypothetical protein PROFUN_09447 [Planoprotostelium fungivorum]